MDEKLDVLIVGGSSDIGQKLIERLCLSDRFNISYTYHKHEINFKKNNIKAFKADLSCSEAVSQFIQATQGMMFNVVVYCPGANPATLSKDLQPSEVVSATWLNYLSPVMLFNDAVGKMTLHRNRQNKLIYVSSVAANKVRTGNGLYGSNKIAVERYLASLAIEMGRFGIRTACVAPAFIESKMLQQYCDKTGISINKIKRETPTGNILTPDDVCNTILAFINNDIVSTGNTIAIGNGEGVFI